MSTIFFIISFGRRIGTNVRSECAVMATYKRVIGAPGRRERGHAGSPAGRPRRAPSHVARAAPHACRPPG